MTPWPIRWNTTWRNAPIDNNWTLVTMLTVVVGLAVLGATVLVP